MAEEIQTALYVVLLVTAAATPKRFPVATVVTLLIVATPSLVQLIAAPQLLAQLERDSTATAMDRSAQCDRVVLVQDGGLRERFSTSWPSPSGALSRTRRRRRWPVPFAGDSATIRQVKRGRDGGGRSATSRNRGLRWALAM